MYIFKLLAGTHQEGKTVYDAVKNPNCKLKSDIRLDKKFKNKFKLVGEIDDDVDLDDLPDDLVSTEEVTLKAIRIDPGVYNVVKVINDKPTDISVLSEGETVDRQTALDIVETGYQG